MVIHFYLLEESVLVDFQRAVERRCARDAGRRVDRARRIAERLQRLAAAHAIAFAELCTLLVTLVLRDERDGAVWEVALNSTLFFCLDARGNVLTSHLLALDARALVALVVRTANIEDNVQARLINMLVKI